MPEYSALILLLWWDILTFPSRIWEVYVPIECEIVDAVETLDLGENNQILPETRMEEGAYGELEYCTVSSKNHP